LIETQLKAKITNVNDELMRQLEVNEKMLANLADAKKNVERGGEQGLIDLGRKIEASNQKLHVLHKQYNAIVDEARAEILTVEQECDSTDSFRSNTLANLIQYYGKTCLRLLLLLCVLLTCLIALTPSASIWIKD
jgi:septal ring factor EnvC (AmiA/AmiB activator)